MKDIRYIDKEDISNLFPVLDVDTNKGDMGRVLLVCGSYDGNGSSMCGAAYLSGAAAYRCGAGIVEIFTARKNYEAIGSLLPEAVYSLYENEENGAEVSARLEASVKKASAVVIGCGLGKSEMARQLLATALTSAECPLVIDADALNLLSEEKSLWALIPREQSERTVITPHPGEMSRLTGLSVQDIRPDRAAVAEAFSRKRGVVCLLKGHDTVITDGNITYINKSGNAGMATAGMGDILSGIIGAVLARESISSLAVSSRIPKNAILYRTAVSAYLHGMSGDLASKWHGEYSLLARDVISELSGVIISCK